MKRLLMFIVLVVLPQNANATCGLRLFRIKRVKVSLQEVLPNGLTWPIMLRDGTVFIPTNVPF